MEQQKLPNTTLILVFGILSIVTCCCYGIIGLILGIVAIVLAKKSIAIYNAAPESYSGIQNIKTGRILAIIGVSLSVLYLLFVVWLVATFGWDTMQDQDLLRERMQDMMGQ